MEYELSSHGQFRPPIAKANTLRCIYNSIHVCNFTRPWQCVKVA